MSEKLKKLREKAGMSQSELGKACGVSRATISLLETGKATNVTSKTMLALATALGTTVDDIFFDNPA